VSSVRLGVAFPYADLGVRNVSDKHPRWCARRERAGEDHVSVTERAADDDDVVYILIRLVQPADLVGIATSLTAIDIEFTEDGVTRLVRLPLIQAIRLVNTIDELLSNTPHFAGLSGVRMEDLRAFLRRRQPMPRPGSWWPFGSLRSQDPHGWNAGRWW
jgi:hypothetical protein